MDINGSAMERASVKANLALYERRLSRLHRNGLSARRNIQAGELIFSEIPICKTKRLDDDDARRYAIIEVLNRMERRSDTTKLRLLNLFRRHSAIFADMPLAQFKEHLDKPTQEAEDIADATFRRYGFPYVKTNIDSLMLTNAISFLNHSCNPNAEISIDGKRLLVRATTEIAADQEITISYINHFQARVKRRQALWFDCRCEECSLTAEALQASDTLRQKFDKGFELIFSFRDKYGRHSPSTCLAPWSPSMTQAQQVQEDTSGRQIMIVVQGIVNSMQGKPQNTALLFATDTAAAIAFAGAMLTNNEEARIHFYDIAMKFSLREALTMLTCTGLDGARTKDTLARLPQLAVGAKAKHSFAGAKATLAAWGVTNEVWKEILSI